MKQLVLFCCLALVSAAPVNKPKKIKLPKAYVYIPSGQLKQSEKNISIQGFFLQATEVSNLEYREFLSDLQANGRTEDYEKARVRPEGWRIPGTYMEPFVEHYHLHPAYENYPVVNITREAALLYCDWLGKQLSENNPGSTISVRLPLETEWMYAAQAGHEGVPYPLGYYLRNAKGQFLYNFRRLGDESIHENPETGAIEVREDALGSMQSNMTIGPAPARSYEANDFGLFNMCGNVAEMLAAEGRTKGGCFNSTGYDIRIDAPDAFAGLTGHSPFIGFRPVVLVLPEKKQ